MAVLSRNSDRRFDRKVSFSGGDGGSLMEVREKEEEEVGKKEGPAEYKGVFKRWSNLVKNELTLVNKSRGR